MTDETKPIRRQTPPMADIPLRVSCRRRPASITIDLACESWDRSRDLFYRIASYIKQQARTDRPYAPEDTAVLLEVAESVYRAVQIADALERQEGGRTTA